MTQTSKCIFLCCGLLLLLSFCEIRAVSAEDYSEIFRRASTLYEQGNYEKAIGLYEDVLDAGDESGNVYYNIGNCHFKAGSLGKALLYYERARRLIPRDADCAANYAYARSLVEKPQMQRKAPFWRRALDYAFGSFTIDELTLMAAFFFCAALVLSGLFVSKRLSARGYMYVLVPTAILFAFVVVTVGMRVHALGKEAIVISEETDVRFGPFDEATVHFSVYEGMRLRVIEKKGSWYKVERSDGTVGWVLKETLEII